MNQPDFTEPAREFCHAHNLTNVSDIKAAMELGAARMALEMAVELKAVTEDLIETRVKANRPN